MIPPKLEKSTLETGSQALTFLLIKSPPTNAMFISEAVTVIYAARYCLGAASAIKIPMGIIDSEAMAADATLSTRTTWRGSNGNRL